MQQASHDAWRCFVLTQAKISPYISRKGGRGVIFVC